MKKIIKLTRREVRRKRIRAKISGTAKRPRLSVFRSGKHIYAQLIDDVKGVTLVSASDSLNKEQKGVKKSKESGSGDTKSMVARRVGSELAGLALKKKITNVVFDRGGYRYQGRVKNLAEGAREGGLKL